MKKPEKENHLDRFAEVANGLNLSKEIANKLANFIHYEVMTAKKTAIDEHKKHLPSEEEIEKMVNKWFREYWEKPNGVIKEIAKAISKRIGE